MKRLNILFTSSGRRVSLIKHFRDTLNAMGIEGTIITTDYKANAPTAFISDYHEIAPRVVDEKEYTKFIKGLVLKYKVDLIIPLIDTELRLMSLIKGEIQELGATILVSSPEIIDISNDKRITYEFFKANNIRTSEVYDIASSLANPNMRFPCILKPSNGSSSIGVTKINNQEELRFFSTYRPDLLLQEFIEGEEYTVDVLVDFSGRILSVVPRLRIETRAGEVSKGMTVKNSIIIEETYKLAEKLKGAVGCITIQCFLTKNDEVVFIEVNPRFGGGIPLSIGAGADFPLWIIQMLLGVEIDTRIDDWNDGVVMLRYDSEIFTSRSDFVSK